jgi:hypothetical protein
MPRHRAGVVGAEDDSRHFIADKISDELLQAFIAVEIDLIIDRGIIMHDFSHDLIFGAAAHDDFISPHVGSIIAMASRVQMRLTWHTV